MYVNVIFYRAMALCVIFMMGRIGSLIGSNIIGVLIAHNCNLIFFIYGGMLASKYLYTLNISKYNIKRKSGCYSYTLNESFRLHKRFVNALYINRLCSSVCAITKNIWFEDVMAAFQLD